MIPFLIAGTAIASYLIDRSKKERESKENMKWFLDWKEKQEREEKEKWEKTLNDLKKMGSTKNIS